MFIITQGFGGTGSLVTTQGYVSGVPPVVAGGQVVSALGSTGRVSSSLTPAARVGGTLGVGA